MNSQCELGRLGNSGLRSVDAETISGSAPRPAATRLAPGLLELPKSFRYWTVTPTTSLSSRPSRVARFQCRYTTWDREMSDRLPRHIPSTQLVMSGLRKADSRLRAVATTRLVKASRKDGPKSTSHLRNPSRNREAQQNCSGLNCSRHLEPLKPLTECFLPVPVTVGALYVGASSIRGRSAQFLPR